MTTRVRILQNLILAGRGILTGYRIDRPTTRRKSHPLVWQSIFPFSMLSLTVSSKFDALRCNAEP